MKEYRVKFRRKIRR